MWLWLCLYAGVAFGQSQTVEAVNGLRHPVTVVNPQVFDAHDIHGIHHHFGDYGFVVVRNLSDKTHRDAVVRMMDGIANNKLLPHARRLGFMDLYHDDNLAQIRQDPRLHYLFSTLFNTPRLWVVFDRVMYWGANEGESNLPPHVDQNPLNNPGFFNMQGMLALRDMNEGTGTLAVVPRSPRHFAQYGQWAKRKDGFIEYRGDQKLSLIALRLREGEMVIWDSRTTHSRFRGSPTDNRYAALITYTPASHDAELLELRRHHFKLGTGWSHYEAGLRATARPRCEETLRENSEQLTPLGRKLYGVDLW